MFDIVESKNKYFYDRSDYKKKLSDFESPLSRTRNGRS